MKIAIATGLETHSTDPVDFLDCARAGRAILDGWGRARCSGIQAVDERSRDRRIPEKPYAFRFLLDTQSAGDVQTQQACDRRVARVCLSDLEEVS